MATKKSRTAPTANPGKASLPGEGDLYQLKVSLLGANPSIWRRVLVPGNLSLAQLHEVLQIAMGWDNVHMHEFRSAQRRFGQPDPAEPFSKTPPVEDERKIHLPAVLPRAGATLTYIYDFGDYWEHEVILEQQLPAAAHTAYPACTEGQLACPPEDCGGVPGYYDLLDVLAKPSHRRHNELRRWVGRDFDPEAFSPDEVNQRLSAPSRGTASRTIQ